MILKSNYSKGGFSMKLKTLLISAIFIALAGTGFAAENGTKNGIHIKQFVKSLNSKYLVKNCQLIPIYGSTTGHSPAKEVR
jgi:hypothetical protein